MKQQAQFDYSLADLFGASVSRLFDSNVEFPSLQKAYPSLFEEEEEKPEVEQTTTNSINNFLAFAMEHNAKMRKGVETINDDD